MASRFSGALISVHDVMPETMERVDKLLCRIERAGYGHASLLVVPGRDWQQQDIERLQQYADAGHELVGHGWCHRVAHLRTAAERLHSIAISRDAGEHLGLDADEIAELISRCGRWFAEHDLPQPNLYVPPAWAMGAIGRTRLRGLGFRYFETLAGIYDSETDTMQRIPVIGFEADTRFRAISLSLANAANRWLANGSGALRIAIHPYDLELKLADELLALLDKPRSGIHQLLRLNG